MTEREKIINIVEQNKYCDVNTAANCRECKYSKELENYKDMGCSSLKTADALIASNIGDVTKWKEQVEFAKRILQIPTLPDGKTDLSYFEYKGERIQDIARQRDEYKHRARVAERAFDNTIKAFQEVLYTMFPNEKIDLDEWKKDNLANAEKELTEEDK